MPRHWQVLLMVALGVGATIMAVPRALSGIVAVPQEVESGISRSVAATPSSKPSTAKMPVWSAAATKTTSPAPSDTKAPSAVTALHVVTNTETSIAIAWEPAKDNVAVKLYLVKREGLAAIQTTETKATLSWPRRTGAVSVQVCAVDTAGNQGEWRSVEVPAPAAPASGPTAVATTSPLTVPNPAAPTTTAPPPAATTTEATSTATSAAPSTPDVVQTAAGPQTATVAGSATPAAGQSA